MALGMMIPGMWTAGWRTSSATNIFSYGYLLDDSGLALALRLKIDPQFGRKTCRAEN